MFEKNEGPKDRTIRAILGLIAAYLGYTSSPWWYIVAGILLFTAATGFCLFYKPFNFDTLNF